MPTTTPESILSLIEPDFGIKVGFTPDDADLCKEKAVRYQRLSPQEQAKATHCFLRYDGHCGAHNKGRIVYLLNPDSERTFTVTVRVHVALGGENLFREKLLTLPPRTKLGLTCTKIFTSPDAALCFTIMKEVQDLPQQ